MADLTFPQWVYAGRKHRTASGAAKYALKADRDWYRSLGSRPPKKRAADVKRNNRGEWTVLLERVDR